MLATATMQLVTLPPEDPQANQCTIHGLRSIIPCISTSARDIWQDMILLALHLWTNPPLAGRLIQHLKEWEDRSTVDWEHGLMLLMARYTLPSSQSWRFDTFPATRFTVGDVCTFGGGSGSRLILEVILGGSPLHVHDQGLASVGSNSKLASTSSLASYQGFLIEHAVDSGVMWTSYTVDLGQAYPIYDEDSNTPMAGFAIDITLNLPPKLSRHTLWCDMRHRVYSTLGTSPDSLLELELVVTITLISRIQLNATLSEHWNKIINYLEEERSRRRRGEGSQNSNMIIEGNPFAGMKLYFHRHDARSAPLREYWGFWSLNSDPTAETGLEGCKEEIKLEVTTLPMENELDRKIKRREEERLAGIPGGWK